MRNKTQSNGFLPQDEKLETPIEFLTNHGYGPDSGLSKDDKDAIDALLDQYETKMLEWRQEENQRLAKAIPMIRLCATISCFKTGFTFGLLKRTHMKNCPCEAWTENLKIRKEKINNA